MRKNLGRRLAQRPKAEAIITRAVAELAEALNVRQVTPTIRALYRRMDAVVERQLAEARKELATHDDADLDVEVLRRSLRRALRRFVHPVVGHLRGSARANSTGPHVDTVRRMFDMDDTGDDDTPGGAS